MIRPGGTSLPFVADVVSGSHEVLDDLDDDGHVEMGRLLGRTYAALRGLDGVGNVHINKWETGTGHISVTLLARPLGVLQLHGSNLPVWADMLPPTPPERGRRRQRVRTGAVLGALAVIGMLGTAETPVLVERAQRVGPAVTDTRMVLPDLLRQPGGWEPSFPRTSGRLSAVGVGTRSRLWSSSNAAWGVSAATGESRFLDLADAGELLKHPVLSADGRLLAYWATGQVEVKPSSRARCRTTTSRSSAWPCSTSRPASGSSGRSSRRTGSSPGAWRGPVTCCGGRPVR